MVGSRNIQPKQPEVDVGQRMRDNHVTQLVIELEPELV